MFKKKSKKPEAKAEDVQEEEAVQEEEGSEEEDVENEETSSMSDQVAAVFSGEEDDSDYTFDVVKVMEFMTVLAETCDSLAQENISLRADIQTYIDEHGEELEARLTSQDSAILNNKREANDRLNELEDSGKSDLELKSEQRLSKKLQKKAKGGKSLATGKMTPDQQLALNYGVQPRGENS